MVASTVLPTSSSMENIPALNFSTTLPITSIESSFGKSQPFRSELFMDSRKTKRGTWASSTPCRPPFALFRLPTVAALTAAAAASAVSTTRSAILFRAGFIDVDGAAIQVAAVQFGNRTIAFRVVAHFNESEPSGLASVAVRHDADAIYGPVRFKQSPD
jgi:hypothetical protein